MLAFRGSVRPQMTKTTVLSIRLDKETRDNLAKHAEALEMKISLLAALVLQDMTDKWVDDHVQRIAEKYGVNKNQEKNL